MDIVEQLKDIYDVDDTWQTAFDAVAEIERLREALAKAEADMVGLERGAMEEVKKWRDRAEKAEHDGAELVSEWVTRALKAEAERDESDDDLFKFIAEIGESIGTHRFLDPPDGGAPSLSEQICRMRMALENAEVELAQAQKELDRTICPYHDEMLDSARNEAFEEAAKVVSKLLIKTGMYIESREAAAEIRSLKSDMDCGQLNT